MQDLLVKARDFMTSDIHSMVKVEVDDDRARLVTEVNKEEKTFSTQTKLMVLHFIFRGLLFLSQ